MRILHGLMSAYHIPLSEAVRLTLPQIIMLNHAAWVDQKEAELRVDAKTKSEAERDYLDPSIDELGGKRMSEVVKDDDLLGNYLSSIAMMG